MMKVVIEVRYHDNPYYIEEFKKIIKELKDLAVIKSYITFKDFYEKLDNYGYIMAIKLVGNGPEHDHPLLKANKYLYDEYAWGAEEFVKDINEHITIPDKMYSFAYHPVYYVFTFPDPVRVPERCAEQSTNETYNEEDVLKFYYCESEDDYYIGKRVDNMYYAKYRNTGFVWFMSRYLPWGKHVNNPMSTWKEHTYPSEPKETPFFNWLTGFLKKYCGGTVEECKEAMEKQIPKEPVRRSYIIPYEGIYVCPTCKNPINEGEHHCMCGQAIKWKCNHAEKNTSSDNDSDMEDIKKFYKKWKNEYLKKLIEEQTPKELDGIYVCPTCYRSINEDEDHCIWCGQSIKWK